MDYIEFKEKFALQLNTQQEKAVMSVNGPVLLLAVPGSGKTTTLIARIGYMIHCCEIPAGHILTLTYTKAAAMDMEERYVSRFGVDGVRFQTINSLCHQILLDYTVLRGTSMFELLAENGAAVAEAYRTVCRDFATESDIRDIQQKITYIKNMMLTGDEIGELDTEELPVSRIYSVYRERMRQQSMMDFDDQLTIAYHVLKRYPDILAGYQRRYPYILVDEAQDTSRIQHEIIGLLASGRKNLFMVGDEDQSIYGFRAAYPKALLDFEKNYPGALILKLETNYRSAESIIYTANRFIRKNRERVPKNMTAGLDIQGEICFRNAGRQSDQYAKLSGFIPQEGSTAILARNNENLIPLIYQFEKDGVPYRCRGLDTGFFSSRVLQDIENIYEYALHQDDPELFLKVYNRFQCFIKRETALMISSGRYGSSGSLWKCLLDSNMGGDKNRDRIRDVYLGLNKMKSMSAYDAIAYLRDHMHYAGEHRDEKIRILLALASEDETMDEFFTKLSDLRETIELSYSNDRGVVLSTIHSSKGLEYDHVIIMDAVQGILPSEDRESIEVERRLFYVAMTRARKIVIVLKYLDASYSPYLTLEFMKKGRLFSRNGTAENGKKVFHKTFGTGFIVKEDGDIIDVDFDGDLRRISLELCLEKGIISLEI